MKYVFAAFFVSSFAMAAPHCSFQLNPGVYYEARVDEGDQRIHLSGPHQTYDAPYVRSSNPETTSWWADFGKGRNVEISQTGSQAKICVASKCQDCQ